MSASSTSSKPRKPRPPRPAPVPSRTPRPYTGFDRNSMVRRPALEYLVASIVFLTGGKVWNNGTHGIRYMRGKPLPSVHGTGRAADLSWRDMRDGRRGAGATRADAVRVMDWLVRHEEALGLEIVIDYHPAPHGRGWRCDREAWSNYSTHTVAGAPGGDWFHIEVSPAIADDLERMRKAIDAALRADA